MTQDASPALSPPRPHRIVHRVRVGFGDTDRAGVVHHARYLHYVEQARVELLRTAGLDYKRFEDEEGFALPVVDVHVRYRQAAFFDDVLDVETWVGELTRAKLRFDSRITRDGLHLTDAKITLVCISRATKRLVSMPRAIWAAVGPSA